MENQRQPDLEHFAQQLAEETKRLIREQFVLFRNAAFPKETQDALDYDTVCLIEDEFRKQETICVDVISSAYTALCQNNTAWTVRYERAISAYVRLSARIMESTTTGLRGHTFTYRIDPTTMPAWKVDAFMQESEFALALFYLKKEHLSQRVSEVFRIVIQKLTLRKKHFERLFLASVRELTETDLEKSHQQIQALINQNSLQREGARHGMN